MLETDSLVLIQAPHVPTLSWDEAGHILGEDCHLLERQHHGLRCHRICVHGSFKITYLKNKTSVCGCHLTPELNDKLVGVK